MLLAHTVGPINTDILEGSLRLVGANQTTQGRVEILLVRRLEYDMRRWMGNRRRQCGLPSDGIPVRGEGVRGSLLRAGYRTNRNDRGRL